jgi:hypothetical protein
MHEAVRILVYGLFAAASPTVLLATLVVLSSKSPRRNGFAFMLAFVLGMTLAFVLALTLGDAVRSNDQHENSRVATLLELLAGLGLLAIAMRMRPPYVPKEPDPESRTEHLFARLAQVRPATVFGIGLPLGVGAKRLTITAWPIRRGRYLLAPGTRQLAFGIPVPASPACLDELRAPLPVAFVTGPAPSDSEREPDRSCSGAILNGWSSRT